VDSETGNQVEFSGRDHAGAHIGSPLPGERRIATVTTITVDDALLNALGRIPRRALLKLFAFPTAYETFSLAGFEAAAGLPLIVTPVHGIAEFLRDGRNGI
jgi:glycosyltransferase involved in cell wall biosynthesis